MDTEKIFKLLDAGFTADEIRGMMAPAKDYTEIPQEDPQPEQVPEKAPASSPAPAAEPEKVQPADTSDVIAKAVTEAMKPFNELYDKMAKLAGMPSLENVKPLGIDDIVAHFFKED